MSFWGTGGPPRGGRSVGRSVGRLIGLIGVIRKFAINIKKNQGFSRYSYLNKYIYI